MPILARLYAPSEFGIAATFASILGVLSIVACGRYEQAIVLPKSEKEAVNVLGLSVGIALVTTIAITVTVFILSQLGGSENETGLRNYIWWIPLATLGVGLSTSLRYWNIRTKNFNDMSLAAVGASVSGNGVKLALAIGGQATAGSLIVSQVVSQLISVIILGWHTVRFQFRLIASGLSPTGIFTALKRYKDFPKYSLWAGVLSGLSWQAPVILLGYFFSATVVGYYALGFKIIQLPMSLIGQAVGSVFLQEATIARERGALVRLIEQTFVKLMTLSMYPMLLLMVIGKDISSVAFGEIWQEAGLYTQILSPWALVWFVSSPLSGLFGVLEKQKEGLKIQIIIFSVRMVALIVGGVMQNAVVAIVMLSSGGVVVYGWLILKILQCANVSVYKICMLTWKHIVSITPYIIIVALTKHLTVDAEITLIVSIAVSLTYVYANKNKLLKVIK